MAGLSGVGFGSTIGGLPSGSPTNFTINPSLFSQAANNATPSAEVLNQFRFLAARSIRQSTIILATFNIIVAFATAAGIMYDSYATAKRNLPAGKGKVNLLKCIQPTETFPFVLSLGIVVQGLVFAIAQSRGLDSLFIFGCSLISQLMWPTLFIVPYLQLVFGVECAIRAMRTRPFPPRGKWTVVMCLAVTSMMLLFTGLIAFFRRALDFCFASLFWFVVRWSEAAFIILLLVFIVLTICAVTIFFRLTRNSMIENTQRVAASRMVYYLALAALSTALIFPFFLNVTINPPRESASGAGLTLSMIAQVVANVSGLLTGGLHLFLRSNTISTIGPKNKKLESDRMALKDKIRVRAPTNIGYSDHMLQPVPRSLQRSDSQSSLISHEKEEEEAIESSPVHRNFYSRLDPNPLGSNAVFPSPTYPQQSMPAQRANIPTPNTLHQRKPSASSTYSLFPSKSPSNTTSVTLLPSTTYSPKPNSSQSDYYSSTYDDFDDTLEPPPAIRVPGGRRRDSSMFSSATVQIGLRLSSVEDMPPMASTIVAKAPDTYHLGRSNEREPGAGMQPSPLGQSEIAEEASDDDDTGRDPVREAKMKTLPPVPRQVADLKSTADEATLSPAVYSPSSPTLKGKIPSPKGVGFIVPKRSNTDLAQSEAASAPSQPKGNSDAGSKPKRDWI